MVGLGTGEVENCILHNTWKQHSGGRPALRESCLSTGKVLFLITHLLWDLHQGRRLRRGLKPMETLTSLPATTLGVWDSSVAPNLSQGALLSTGKTGSGLTHFS